MRQLNKVHLHYSLFSLVGVLLVRVIIAVQLAFAQAPDPDQQEVPIFRAETRLVVLYVTVIDEEGNFVLDLPRSAFRVYEDGVEQQIRIFRREDIPVSMGLVIDNSGSMRDKRRAVEAAALLLVEHSHPDDEVFIVNFNDEAYLDVPMTGKIEKLKEGLERLDSRGGTAMRDAVSLSLDYLVKKGTRDKKVLLLITDGNDNSSYITLEQLVRKVHQSEAIIYAIGILTDETSRERRRAMRALKAITEASGGYAYFPKNLDEVKGIALEIARDIRNQYVIAYSPKNQVMDGTFRRVEVKVKGRNNPRARTRTGYYATPLSSEAVPAESNSQPGG